jgi:hypothetical protein
LVSKKKKKFFSIYFDENKGEDAWELKRYFNEKYNNFNYLGIFDNLFRLKTKCKFYKSTLHMENKMENGNFNSTSTPEKTLLF